MALPENWWAAVKWQCLGVFSSVTLPVVCESGSTEGSFAICTARGV